MKHSRSLTARGLVVFAAVIFGTIVRADDIASDQEGPAVDVSEAARFTVPAAVGGPARYRISVQFAGDTEQSIGLYVWAADSNDSGHWQRRLFYNNYWQGTETTAVVWLESGRNYALLAHQKPAPLPGFGLPWTQMKIAPTVVPADTADAAPFVRATFSQSHDLATVVTMQPVAPVAAAGK